jgi:glycosyltransferase involved in cell wall biosynthesis
MESLACGTPVFGFKTGGVQEMIVNGFNGALVEQRDVNSLANEIETLWNSESFSALSTNARHDACSKYGLDLMLDKHLELYEELIHSHLAMEERVD